jgi:S1 RNA binding domain protein
MELEIGAILAGKVTGITKFGAFVALPGGRSGLVHISEVAYSYVNDVSEFLTVGQEVNVKVISVDENKRINLSIKQTLPPPARPERSGGRGDGRSEGRERFGNGGGRRGGFNNNRGSEERGEGGNERRFERSGSYGGNRPSRPANPRPSTPKEPQNFDDMLKQYMSESETKLSQLNRGERRSRRGRRNGGGNGSF